MDAVAHQLEGNVKLLLMMLMMLRDDDDEREHPDFVQIQGKRYFLRLRVKYLDIPNFQKSGLC